LATKTVTSLLYTYYNMNRTFSEDYWNERTISLHFEREQFLIETNYWSVFLLKANFHTLENLKKVIIILKDNGIGVSESDLYRITRHYEICTNTNWK
jgi:hypothetical protein